jgi:hypothetical protein
VEAEAEASRSASGKLCATPFGIDVVGITEAIALVGALVGGVSARQRKAELEEVNEKLRAINISLRQQARAGVVYAPGEPRLRCGMNACACFFSVCCLYNRRSCVRVFRVELCSQRRVVLHGGCA